MSEMIERVAKALRLRADQEPPPHQEALRNIARIAIEAMRDPTEEQLRAAWDKVDYNIDDFWRVMIDASLKCEEPKP